MHRVSHDGITIFLWPCDAGAASCCSRSPKIGVTFNPDMWLINLTDLNNKNVISIHKWTINTWVSFVGFYSPMSLLIACRGYSWLVQDSFKPIHIFTYRITFGLITVISTGNFQLKVTRDITWLSIVTSPTIGQGNSNAITADEGLRFDSSYIWLH